MVSTGLQLKQIMNKNIEMNTHTYITSMKANKNLESVIDCVREIG